MARYLRGAAPDESIDWSKLPPVPIGSYTILPSRESVPGYSIMPLPKSTDGGFTTQPAPLEQPTPGGGSPAPGGTAPAPSTPPAAAALGGFLDGSLFGIPVKYILIGVAAWFLLKR